MKFNTNTLFIFAFFALILCSSCDDEALDNNVETALETLLPNSNLANLMEGVSSFDNFECVDFQYPIWFTLYNSNFQVIETVTIQSDSALLSFLESLGTSSDGVVLASLNFPVTLMYENETSVVANNNQELEAAITSANTNCSEPQTCDFSTVRDYLVACPQIPTLNGFTPSFTTFIFHDSNQLSTVYELDLPYNGSWDIAMIEGELKIFINLNGLENFNGEYSIVSCLDDELVLQQGDDILMLSRACVDENPFGCFESFDAQITMCDEGNDGFETFDLTQVFANCTQPSTQIITYHMSVMDAETGTNAIGNPQSYSNTVNPAETVFVRVELIEVGTFGIFSIDLILEDCNCTEEQVDNYLLECHWNVVNYNGSSDLIGFDMDFETSGVVVIYNDTITIDAGWSTSMSASGVILEFSNVAGPNIQAISGNWTIIDCGEDRLEMTMGTNTMVLERTCN